MRGEMLMSYINVTEVDNTQYIDNTDLNVQAIALVPMLATKGKVFKPKSVRSVFDSTETYGVLSRTASEYKTNNGDEPPAGAPLSWLYGYGLVKSGIPVYSVRIQLEDNEVSQATGTVSNNTGKYQYGSAEEDNYSYTVFTDVNMKAIEEGTSGNSLMVYFSSTYNVNSDNLIISMTTMRKTSDSTGVKLEVKPFSIDKSILDSDKSNEEIANDFESALVKGLKSISSDYVTITIEDDPNLGFKELITTIKTKYADTGANGLAKAIVYCINGGNTPYTVSNSESGYCNAYFKFEGGSDGVPSSEDATSSYQALAGNANTRAKFINAAAKVYEEFKDKFKYDIMFVTSSGYSGYDHDKNTSSILESAIRDLAESRGDCIGFIDPPTEDMIDRASLTDPLAKITEDYLISNDTNSSYLTASAPWCTTRNPADTSEIIKMAPSYFALTSIGRASNDGFIWQPPAGVARATLTDVIQPEYEIGDELQSRWQNSYRGINPIMNLRNYGYVMFGQRTLLQSPTGGKGTSLEALNVRLISCVIKKYIYEACTRLSFQNNTIRLWNEFKAIMNPKLENMKCNDGLDDYLVVMDERTVTADAEAAGRVPGYVIVSPFRAAEKFDIQFVLAPTGAEFDVDNTGKVVINDSVESYDSVYGYED